MQELATDVIWQNRLEQIDSEVDDIRFIDTVSGVDQDEEWCEIVARGEKRRIRFHDYADLFRIPGLYEELFYDRLECCSPSYISNLLNSVVHEMENASKNSVCSTWAPATAWWETSCRISVSDRSSGLTLLRRRKGRPAEIDPTSTTTTVLRT